MAKKKTGTELVSLAELAKRAGVTRGAVTRFIEKTEKRGVVLAVKMGRRGKVVDICNPVVKRYLENSGGTSKREHGAESPENRSDNFLRKLEYQTKRLQIQNTLLQEKYISRNAAIALLDELAELEKRLFSGWAGRVLDKIETEGKIKIPPEKYLKARVLIEETLERVRKTNGRIIDKFRKDTAPKNAGKKRA
jgi:AcrR family transcriptional regulator